MAEMKSSLNDRVDEAVVRKLAGLAKIQLDESEVSTLLYDLRSILKHVGQIDSLDLTHVAPTAHGVALQCPMHDDVVRAPLDMANVLLNAPDKEATAFKVPKIIQDDES